jgi:hypothetical protein
MRRLIFAFVLLLLAVPSVALSEVIICGENVTLPFSSSAQTCSVELFLRLTEGSTLPSLFGTTLNATVSPALAGASITGVGKTVNHPYVFNTTGPVGNITASNIDVADFDFSMPPAQDGAGLGKIDFSIAAGATGKFHILISNDTSLTYFLDNSGNSIPLGASIPGSITVVPEPGSIALLLSGTLAVAAWFWRRSNLRSIKG